MLFLIHLWIELLFLSSLLNLSILLVMYFLNFLSHFLHLESFLLKVWFHTFFFSSFLFQFVFQVLCSFLVFLLQEFLLILMFQEESLPLSLAFFVLGQLDFIYRFTFIEMFSHGFFHLSNLLLMNDLSFEHFRLIFLKSLTTLIDCKWLGSILTSHPGTLRFSVVIWLMNTMETIFMCATKFILFFCLDKVSSRSLSILLFLSSSPFFDFNPIFFVGVPWLRS